MGRSADDQTKLARTLAMVGNVATLFGLFGTVVGLVVCFRAVSSSVDPAIKASLLSLGISRAMNCTALGLVIATPALLARSAVNARR